MKRVLAFAAMLACVARPTAQDAVAYVAVDLRSGATTASVNAARLERPTEPGSIAKIATLAAALESGVIGERTAIACTRDAVVGRHHLTCTHPDFHRPLQPSEALAQSCNVYFASIAARLTRPALDRALASLGLPLSDRRASVAEAALGIDGIRVPPRALVDMMARVAEEPTRLAWKPSTIAVVREGLTAAAHDGTAGALASRGIDALAKTGTVLTSSGVEGLVVGVTPASHPTTGFVLLASGGAGVDAAALAAERLRPAPPTSPAAAGRTVRVGIARDGGGYTVNVLPLEEYVAGVVAGEAARDSSPAALEALAVTVRTFAMANMGRHRAEGFDLCDLTHCQVFRKATAATTRAADATAGRFLVYRGAPASVFYTASCGGHTEHPSAVWPGADDPGYLPSRADDACEGQPAWSADLTAEQIARALRSAGFTGDRLRDLRVAERNDSGRVTRLRIEGFSPDRISGQDLRTIVGRTLGWQFIKSTAFSLDRTGSGFRFTGHGSGHGVGLCVIGSAHLAARGESAAMILARYFPGLETSAAPPLTAARRTTTALTGPEIVVALAAGDEGERNVVRDIAARARDGVARQLGVPVPPALSLRFHPTVESYQRATGQPWFTAGATTGTDLQFVPLAVLRERGILERTIRHEIVHAMTGQALADRRLWVREGAASYFAGERATNEGDSARSRPKAACPADEELRAPTSPGAMSNAYARATACFARQLAAGKSWRDVK